MKILVFLGIAIVEYVMITIITGKISKIKEYIPINYDVFRFKNIGERKCGLNILISIIFPIVYTITCAGILYKLNLDEYIKGLYIVNILYFIIRWFALVVVYDWRLLNDWKSEALEFSICTALNLLIHYFFIVKTRNIFISIDELKNAVWIGIITFVFVVIRDYIYGNIKINNLNSEKRKKKYILTKYKEFKAKYDYIINTEDEVLRKITYSIMIYENYSRPPVIRKLEYVKFLIKKEASLGIMQFKTNKLINDKESVEKGFEKIKAQYLRNIGESKEKNIEKTILNYNYSYKYYEEVKYIMSVIVNI